MKDDKESRRKKKIKSLSVFDDELSEPVLNPDPLIDAPIDIRLAFAAEQIASRLNKSNENSLISSITQDEAKSSNFKDLVITKQTTIPSVIANENVMQEANIVKTEKVRTKLEQNGDKVGTEVGTNLEQQEDSEKQNEQTSNKVRTQTRTNLEQSQNKLGTKLEQSGDKAGTEVGTNLEQQEDSEKQNEQTSNKVRTQPRTEVGTKSEQSQSKVRTKVPFSQLTGLQRTIPIFIFSQCQISRSKITNPIAIKNLAFSCQTTVSSAQVTIRRLESKLILTRAEYKDGRGGWTRYELENDIYNEILHNESQNKLGTNLEQSQSKVNTQPRTEPITTFPSTSSDLYTSTM